MQRHFNLFVHAALAAMIAVCSISISVAQTRKDIIQPGEELVYKAKYGFIKLGTVVMQTGAISADGTTVSARMHFRTADNPFLHAETTDLDQFYTNDLSLHTFEEHTQTGDDKSDKYSTYDRATKTLTYSDEKESNVIKHNIRALRRRARNRLKHACVERSRGAQIYLLHSFENRAKTRDGVFHQ